MVVISVIIASLILWRRWYTYVCDLRDDVVVDATMMKVVMMVMS